MRQTRLRIVVAGLWILLLLVAGCGGPRVVEREIRVPTDAAGERVEVLCTKQPYTDEEGRTVMAIPPENAALCYWIRGLEIDAGWDEE